MATLRAHPLWSMAGACAFALLVACGGKAQGRTADAGPSEAAPGVSDAVDAACSPQPVSSLPPFVPPNAPRSVCTSAQILAYYDACWSDTQTAATCSDFEGDPANSPCILCVRTESTAASYGAVVEWPNKHGQANIGGCIALIDGDTSTTGCGAAYEALDACREQACLASCDTTPNSEGFGACETEAVASVCAPEAQAAQCGTANIYEGCLFADFEAYFRGLGQLFCAGGFDAGSDSGSDGSGWTPAVEDAESGAVDVADANAPQTPDDGVAVAPEAGGAPGAYLTIDGSALSGMHLLAQSGGCGGTFDYSFNGMSNMGVVTVEVDAVSNPQVGTTYTTPKVTVTLQFGTIDDGTYPQGGHGTCSATDESAGWPTVGTVPFSCAGVVGVGSGQPFSVAGEIVCP